MKSNFQILNLDKIFQRIKGLREDTLSFVIDEEVWRLYRDTLQNYFNELERVKRIIIWKSKRGESAKKFSEYQNCVEYFLEQGVHRNAHLIAIGGGATSDFAGFVAASILRGISWSIIPTTLIGMIDAGIGGKTGINSIKGKNLIGAFYLPKNIWLDLSFLKTLNAEQMLSGKGEILKYALISKKIYKLASSEADISKLIIECTKFKQKIVKKDYKEKKLRKILNFGHTFGHAYETCYHLPHGVAVIWGIETVLRLFGRDKLLSVLKELILQLKMEELAPPWNLFGLKAQEILEMVAKDKKMSSSKEIELVLLEKIGKPEIEKVSISEIKEKFYYWEVELKKEINE